MLKKKSSTLLGAALLFAAVLLIYAQTLRHDFISFDDTVYVTENPYVRAGLTWPGVVWAFTRFHDTNWFPVTWVSHMLDVQFFGLHAGLHHQSGFLLHAVNSLLLWLALSRLSGRRGASFFTAMLFAVHPLHVESVAWVAERKDVLSGFFFMLTLLAYTNYVQGRSRKAYFAVLAFYALGLMSKPMLVTLPYLLFVLDFWPLNRLRTAGIRKIICEKIPLLLMSALSCGVTFYAQHSGGATVEFARLPLTARLANALVTAAVYLRKMIWPLDLGIFYPYSGDRILFWNVAGSFALIAGISAGALWVRRRYPWFLAGWLWYLGMLVPVIGLIQVGSQAMADRYTYLPLIGVFVMLVWGARDVLSAGRLKGILPGAGAVFIIAALTGLAFRQAGYWKDSITLFQHALAVTKENYLAHQNIGSSYAARGEYEKAVFHLEEALRISPGDSEAANNLANVFRDQGKREEARQLYMEILSKNPRHFQALVNRGALLTEDGDYQSAAIFFEEALSVRSNDKRPYKGLASIAYQTRNYSLAADYFLKALECDPYDKDSNSMLGDIHAAAGDWSGAEMFYSKVLQGYPEDANILNNLGNVLALQGSFERAIPVFLRGIQSHPENVSLRLNLAVAYAKKGERDKAIPLFKDVLRLDPQNARAKEKLAEILTPSPAA